MRNMFKGVKPAARLKGGALTVFLALSGCGGEGAQEGGSSASYPSYKEAARITAEKCLPNKEKWAQEREADADLQKLPLKPDEFYKGKGWISWEMFLGSLNPPASCKKSHASEKAGPKQPSAKTKQPSASLKKDSGPQSAQQPARGATAQEVKPGEAVSKAPANETAGPSEAAPAVAGVKPAAKAPSAEAARQPSAAIAPPAPKTEPAAAALADAGPEDQDAGEKQKLWQTDAYTADYTEMLYNMAKDILLKREALGQKITSDYQIIKPLQRFCLDAADCSKGLKPLKSFSPSDIAYFIKVNGWHAPPIEVSAEPDQEANASGRETGASSQEAKGIFVLQGNLSLHNFKDADKGLAKFWAGLDPERKLKSMVINVESSPGLSPMVYSHMIALGQFIKERGMTLYILGKCESLCAAYLLPMAQSIQIGPFGHIALNSAAAGFLYERAKRLKAKAQEEFARYINEKLFGYGLSAGAAAVLYVYQQAATSPVKTAWGEFLEIFGEYDSSLKRKLEKRLDDFLRQRNIPSYESMDRGALLSFSQSLPYGLKQGIKAFAMTDDSSFSRFSAIINRLKEAKEQTASHLSSFARGGFVRLLDIAGDIIPQDTWDQTAINNAQFAYFENPQDISLSLSRPWPCAAEAKRRSFSWIAPTAPLLRQLLEIPIDGENHAEALNFYTPGSENRGQYITEEEAEALSQQSRVFQIGLEEWKSCKAKEGDRAD